MNTLLAILVTINKWFDESNEKYQSVAWFALVLLALCAPLFGTLGSFGIAGLLVLFAIQRFWYEWYYTPPKV